MSEREHGSKPGSGGLLSQDAHGVARRERLRNLAASSLDMSKDPYIFRNHLGQYECKLCLSVHINEGQYLAHTQARRHQQNLQARARRNAMDRGRNGLATGIQKAAPSSAAGHTPSARLRTGRPGYRLAQLREEGREERGLLVEVLYPDLPADVQPRYRLMSTYEQTKEPPNPAYQFLVFAAYPFETIAFKIPNRPIVRDVESDHAPQVLWDRPSGLYSLRLFFKPSGTQFEVSS